MRLRFALALFLLTPQLLPAAEYVQQQAGDKATVRMEVDNLDGGAAVIALNRAVKLTITLEGAAPIALVGDEKDMLESIDHAITISGLWMSRSHSKPSFTQDKSRWEVVYTLEPRPPDPAGRDPKRSDPQVLGGGTLQLPRMSFADGSGTIEISWAPIRVTFTTAVENPDNPSPAQLKDIPGPEQPPAPPRFALWKWLVLGAAAAVLVASLVATAVLYIVWRKAQPVLTPSQFALRELDRLDSQRLSEAGQAEHFHTDLSNIVRDYLERQYRLRAPQQTTPEFLAVMQSWPLLPAPQQQLLKTFLERCDMVKFARLSQTLEECQATAAMARQIVEHTPAGINASQSIAAGPA